MEAEAGTTRGLVSAGAASNLRAHEEKTRTIDQRFIRDEPGQRPRRRGMSLKPVMDALGARRAGRRRWSFSVQSNDATVMGFAW